MVVGMKKPVFKDDLNHLTELRQLSPGSLPKGIRTDIANTPEWRRFVWMQVPRLLGFLGLWVIVGIAMLILFGPPGWFATIVAGFVIWIVYHQLRIAPVTAFQLRRLDALNKRRCPACWTSMDDSEPEWHGCTTCPECGAAWRLGDIENE